MKFIKQWLVNPLETGAVAPSSNELSKLITDTANLSKKKCVVELGSGTGVFTKDILKKISSDCVFFALEINSQFVEITKKNCPDALVYHDAATKIQKYLLQNGQKNSDCIVSSIHWANLKPSLQKELLTIVHGSLEDGGEFLTFAYLHSLFLPRSVKLRRLLSSKFSHVQRTKVIWKNIPPACVIYCKK